MEPKKVDFSIKINMNAIKDKLTRLGILYKKKKDKENELEEAKEDFKKLEAEVFAEMEDADFQSISCSGKIFFLKVDTYYSIKNKEKVFDWLIDRGLDSIIKKTVNTRTLGSEIKRLAKEEDFIDPEIVNKNPVKRVGIKKK